METDAGVIRLVTVMASYQAANPGFNPIAPAVAMLSYTRLQSVITENWHRQ